MNEQKQNTRISKGGIHEYLIFSKEEMNNLDDCVISIGLEGKIERWNRGASRIFGYSREEILGKPIETISDPKSLQVSQSVAFRDTFKSGTPVIREWEGRDKNGNHVTLLLTCLLLHDGDGIVNGAVWIGRDITRCTQAEIALVEQKHLLEQKEAALREILHQTKGEKERMEQHVQANVDHLLNPVIDKLREKSTPEQQQFLELLDSNLKQITSHFGSDISSRMLKLTPKEISICNMIKNGFSSKQISDALHISTRTIETHRNSIRRKLHLSGKSVNLTTYLNFLK